MSVEWTFGEYRILKKIATGGMAEVFLAKRVGAEGFEKLLAIKRILPQFSENEDFLSMFIDEAKLVAQLNHRNIVQIYDFGNQQGSYYIAMEYVSGKDVRSILKKSIEKQSRVPAAQAVYLIAEAAKGLEYAHHLKDPLGNPLQIIHRDISPQNILISYEGEVLVADFGIAKAASKSMETRAGVLKGKIPYMSPEQAWGRPIDKRSDLYSLGVVLYELITYQKVFDADSEFSLLEKVRNAEVDFPPGLFQKVPTPIFQILKKALQKRPEDRYQSAHEMHVDLENYLLVAKETSSERNLSNYLKNLFQGEIEDERRILLEKTEASGEETAPIEPGSKTKPQKPLSPPESGRAPLLVSLKEALKRSDVRMKAGVLMVLCILGVVTVIHLLTERNPSPLPSIGVSSPSSSSPSAAPSSSSLKIKLDLSKEEPSKGTPPREEPAKGEPSKEEPSRGAPPKGEPSKEESSRGARPGGDISKEEPSPPKRKSDQSEPQEKTVPPRKEERKEVQPVQRTGKGVSAKRAEVKPPVFLADLLRQGPDLLREDKQEIVLERISRLPEKEKENINVKILECFAHLKKWFQEPKPFVKKLLPPIKKPLWKNLYDSLSRSGDRSGTPFLLRIVKDPEKNTRFYAVSLLGSIGDERALKDLQQIASSDSSEKIRETAKQSISSIQPPSSTPSGPSALFPEAR